MNRFKPSVESLETRETPSGLASVTDMVLDSYNPAASDDSYYGTGVYKSTDGGQTWADSGGASGRVTGIAADQTDPAAGTGGTISVHFHVIRHGSGVAAGNDSIWLEIAAPIQTAAGTADADMKMKGSKIGENAPVSANETITIDGARTETAGNVYTVTFGGSLVG